MKFFKNRAVALILCVLIVVGATLLNTHVKFGALCRNMTNTFFDDGEIYQQLRALQAEAVRLAAVAEKNGLDTADLSAAAEDLQRCMIRGDVGAKRFYASYNALCQELSAMEQSLLSTALSEEDAEAVSLCLTQIHTAQAKIAASPYNDNVREFLQKYDRFPTSILADLAEVSMPEEFA